MYNIYKVHPIPYPFFLLDPTLHTQDNKKNQTYRSFNRSNRVKKTKENKLGDQITKSSIRGEVQEGTERHVYMYQEENATT